MSNKISIVATFADHDLAEVMVKKLQLAGFDGEKLSIVGDRAAGAGNVPMLGGLDELDAEAYACIPGDDVLDYEDELRSNRLLLVVHGTADEIAQAKSIIDTAEPAGWNGKVGAAVYYGCAD